MTIVNLDPRHLETLIEILSKYPAISKASIFGSRALRTNDAGSDVDLVLFGNIDEQLLGLVRNDVEETSLPYFFDILSHDSITHTALLKHIEDHAITVFTQENLSSMS